MASTRRSIGAGVALALVSLLSAGCPRSRTSESGAAAASSASSVASIRPLPPAPTSPPPPDDKFPLDEAAIDAIVNPSHATEYTGPTGVVEGVVRVTGDPARMRQFIPLPKPCEAAVPIHGPDYRAGPGGELADALVAVIKTSGYVRPSRADKVVTIKQCSITPTLIDLSVGQRLLVANDDDSPYTPNLPTRKIITRLAIKGMSPVPLFLTTPAAYAMTWLPGALPGADVPTATVFVLPNALHMTTDLDGKFRVAGVPVGKARLVVSHLGMPEFGKDIEIKAGEVVKIDAPMTYRAPPASSAPAHPVSSIQ